MKKPITPLVIGNWKMNPNNAAEATLIARSVLKAANKAMCAEVVIAPPLIFLAEVSQVVKKGGVRLAAQNIHQEPGGAHTGEHSLSMVTSYGVTYCIIGHSERRAAGETDELVAVKITATLKAKCVPVVCVGERERDSQGNFFLQIEEQVRSLLAMVPKTRYKEIVIAYEPIWAIGTGNTATVDDVVEMRLFINKVITKYYGASAAAQVRVLYGGSVNAGNAAVLYQTGSINGFLVGGASLKPVDFATIINATK